MKSGDLEVLGCEYLIKHLEKYHFEFLLEFYRVFVLNRADTNLMNLAENLKDTGDDIYLDGLRDFENDDVYSDQLERWDIIIYGKVRKKVD